MTSNRPDIVVAERLKRLDSIINKLKREPNMSLWTMQDLGGCRFIVPTVNEVFLYAEKYKNSRIRQKYPTKGFSIVKNSFVALFYNICLWIYL